MYQNVIIESDLKREAYDRHPVRLRRAARPDPRDAFDGSSIANRLLESLELRRAFAPLGVRVRRRVIGKAKIDAWIQRVEDRPTDGFVLWRDDYGWCHVSAVAH